jgi:threonine aldolase
MMIRIDLRSDTVTKPTREMRAIMAEAAVGDDVYGEDPTVNLLEERGAEMLGKQAALYAPSGTQTNLLALMSHCQRGEEYIVGQLAHTYKYEAGGAAVLGSIQPQPLDFEPDGTLDLDRVEAAIKPENYHFARTRLLCLENTHNGMALPLDYPARARSLADKHGLKMHLDGARIFNAAAKSQVEARDLAAHFDTVSVCLSKGLGAPVGSLLCGDEALITRARRWRKMVGGGMRQAGIIAAAGLHALEHNRERLGDDHQRARNLADGLNGIAALEISYGPSQTNMVFMTPPEGSDGKLQPFLAEHGVAIPDGGRVRMVTHLDIGDQDILEVIELCRTFFA